ncbi:hypothetical protein AB0451_25830 [Streptomyces sp. NPDC052000]|uniref:hypothetical protein n=1 Tax=Streptomyces sp. NPDC052000 TaxID=3155676 RepID=UPI00344EC0CF
MKSLRRILAVLMLVAAAGCGLLPDSNTQEGRRSTMDMQQGAETADGILQQTLAGITPPLSWQHGPSTDRGCAAANNSETGTGTATRRIEVLTIVSEERRGSLLGVIERHWRALGYKITSVNPSKEMPAVFASTPDDFRLGVTVGDTGQFIFNITTPCFRDASVSAPHTKANTPARSGLYPHRPDIHDGFWSATTPAP